MSGVGDMSVTVNGEPRQWPGGAVSALLTDCQVDTAKGGFAVALNGAVLPRAKWSETLVSEGDRVEIVGMYKGG